MEWDWDGKYIDTDEDDGRDWVPVMLQTLKMKGTEHGEKAGGAGGDFAKQLNVAKDAPMNRPTMPI